MPNYFAALRHVERQAAVVADYRRAAERAKAAGQLNAFGLAYLHVVD